jgi:CRP-like cAMP-binding protein
MSDQHIAVAAEHSFTGQDPHAVEQNDAGNWLIQRMHPADFDLLRPHLRRVPVISGDQLAEAGSAIETVCFPESGVAGFLDVLDDGRKIAVGLLGREGFVGWPLLMGNDRWPHEVMARGRDGTALQIDASRLKKAVAVSPGLGDFLVRYASAFVTQMSRTLVSNLIHSIERRTARWLLLYHDRLDSDELTITHEELSIMLGVRRASVTEALHQLEGNGSIRGHRGKLVIRDRAALVALTCETYGQAEAEYLRLIETSAAI